MDKNELIEKIYSININFEEVFEFFREDLQKIVDFPFYVSKKKYVYEDEEEKKEVEQEVLLHFLKVLAKIRQTPSILANAKTSDDVRRIVVQRVRNSVSPTLYKILNLQKRTIALLYGEELKINHENVEQKILENEKKKVIASAIAEFLRSKSKLDTIIFLQFLTKKAQYGKYEIHLSIDQIAKIFDVSIITVKRHKGRLLQEFRSLLIERLHEYECA